jgi:dipeptidyl-peptidase-3
METSGAIKMVDRNGKTYVQVVDYPKMHEAVGKLLAEIMRTKAEGDYDALKALIDKYGVNFDPKLRDQVVKRYSALNIPAYWAGVNPELDAKMAGGKVQSVSMRYPKDAVHQYIYYGSMYAPDLKVPVANGASRSKVVVKKASASRGAAQPK